MPRSRVIAPLVELPVLDLDGWMTRLGGIQEPAELESEICVAFGQLLGLEAVGSDLEFRGSLAAPTLKIGEMTVGGK